MVTNQVLACIKSSFIHEVGLIRFTFGKLPASRGDTRSLIGREKEATVDIETIGDPYESGRVWDERCRKTKIAKFKETKLKKQLTNRPIKVPSLESRAERIHRSLQSKERTWKIPAEDKPKTKLTNNLYDPSSSKVASHLNNAKKNDRILFPFVLRH